MWLLGSAALASVACGSADAPRVTANEPGSSTTTTAQAAKELACKSDTDCRTGEKCGNDGFCKLRRCADTLPAPPKLAGHGYLSLYQGLVTASEKKASLHGFEAKGAIFSANAVGEHALAGTIVDVASGKFDGSRAQSTAVATSTSTKVMFEGPTERALDVPFVPVAIAAGDVNGDGIDELVVAAADNRFAVCTVATNHCDAKAIPGGAIIDVGVGDADGDGFVDATFLLSDARVTLANIDAAGDGAMHVLAAPPGNAKLKRLAVGDLDGNGKPEVYALEDGGWFGSDKLHRLSLTADTYALAFSTTMRRTALDLDIGHLAGKQADLVVLTAANTVQVMALAGASAFTTPEEAALPVPSGETAHRVAASDFSGNSPAARLKKDPTLLEGKLQPIAAIFAPPYSKTYSAGTSAATLGAGTVSGGSHTESFSTSYGAMLGVQVNAGVAGFGGSFHYGWGTSTTKSLSDTVTQGASFTYRAAPDQDGYDTGAVMISCACYYQYEYEIEDPTHRLDPAFDKAGMMVYLPVGPRTTVLSLRRYNAMAALVPDELPQIHSNFTLGKVSSYPTKPTRIDGAPIDAQDLVFPGAQALRVSDTVDVGFSLDSSTSQSNSTASQTSSNYNFHAFVGMLVSVQVGGDITTSHDVAEEVHVGTSTSFSGSIPPIRDDPKTPEDEYKANAYSFTPIVYKHAYKMPNGASSAFYALTYTVGP